MSILSTQKIALVYDRVNKWGGAERVLLALHEMFPQAPLFTAVYDPDKAKWANVFPEVISSFLQKFPWAKSRHELYPWLTPLAFESFNFDKFDIVISVTSADAKGIITKPNTFHLCYCLTPTRYLWSHEDLYKSQTSPLFKPLFNYLKSWDLVASHRPDAYIAISKTVQSRISNFYHLKSGLVYPPVDVDKFGSPSTISHQLSVNSFYLYVGRLVAYKQAEIIVQVFNDLQLPLAIIGQGSLEPRLRRLAKANIQFLGQVSDEILAAYYQQAKALIFFHEEDFGIVPVEAMAAGTPVIGLNTGGVSETVLHGITGQLVNNSQDSLKNAILNFDQQRFDSEVLKTHAQKFSKDRFKREFSTALVRAYSSWRRRHPSLATI